MWHQINEFQIYAIFIVFFIKDLYRREITWRIRDLVRTHRTLNTTSCSYRVAYVCPAGKLLDKKLHLRVASVCDSVAIVWPSVGIVIASAVDWLATKFGAIFARNSKFHIRVAIWCQVRDSVTPALDCINRISKYCGKPAGLFSHMLFDIESQLFLLQ